MIEAKEGEEAEDKEEPLLKMRRSQRKTLHQKQSKML